MATSKKAAETAAAVRVSIYSSISPAGGLHFLMANKKEVFCLFTIEQKKQHKLLASHQQKEKNWHFSIHFNKKWPIVIETYFFFLSQYLAEKSKGGNKKQDIFQT